MIMKRIIFCINDSHNALYIGTGKEQNCNRK